MEVGPKLGLSGQDFWHRLYHNPIKNNGLRIVKKSLQLVAKEVAMGMELVA